MAHTKREVAYSGYVTDNPNTYSYSGSFDVFKGTEVIVTLDGVALTFTSSTINESASPREYTVDTTAKTIHIGGGNLSSGTIVIRPQTDMGAPTPRATYTPGASITAADLNNNQTQLMRKAMEYDETKMSSTGGTMTGDLTMGQAKKIIFEGATDDGYETTLTVADPTGSDKTITLPNETGNVIVDTLPSTKIWVGNGAGAAAEVSLSGDVTMSNTGAVTIASTAVETGMIANDAVNADKLASNAVVNDSVDSSAAIEFTKLENLDSAKILVGNSSNKATEVTMSGDVAIANTGATTIQPNAVEIGMIGCEQTTISDSDSHIPTSGAVVDYVSAQISPLGGFEAIADEDNFPTTEPAAGVIISIADATGIQVDNASPAKSTNCRTAGNGSDNVTITGFPDSLKGGATHDGITNANPYTLPANTGLLCISTGSSHTYTFHRLLPTSNDVRQLSDDVNDFFERYRIASSAPGSSNDVGDLYFNTSDNLLYVRNAANNAWITAVSTSPGTGSVDTAQLATDAVTGDKIEDDAVAAEHIADNAVGLAAMAGLARGKIIYGNASGDPTALAIGSNGQTLVSDGTDISWGDAAAGAKGGGSDKIFWENGQTVTSDYTITNNFNAGSFGPITINNGVTVTVGSGENWTIV